MSSQPLNPYRFLPTLTEVVDPTTLVKISTENQSHDDIVASVLGQLGPVLERRLSLFADEAIQKLLAQQRQTLLQEFRQELETSIREMISAHFNPDLGQDK